MRDKVERGELLEHPNRISGAEHGHRARKPYIFRARRSRGQNHHRRRIEELGAVMLANAKNIQANLIGKLDLFQQMLHALDRGDGKSRGWVGNGCGKAVDTDLHFTTPDGWQARVADSVEPATCDRFDDSPAFRSHPPVFLAESSLRPFSFTRMR